MYDKAQNPSSEFKPFMSKDVTKFDGAIEVRFMCTRTYTSIYIIVRGNTH